MKQFFVKKGDDVIATCVLLTLYNLYNIFDIYMYKVREILYYRIAGKFGGH